MHRQRLLLLVCAVAGLIAIYLPWVRLPFPGCESSLGPFLVVPFVVVGIVACTGVRFSEVEGAPYHVAVVAGLLAGSIAVVKIVDLKLRFADAAALDPEMAMIGSFVHLGIGLYLIAAAGLAVPIGGKLTRDPTAPRHRIEFDPSRNGGMHGAR